MPRDRLDFQSVDEGDQGDKHVYRDVLEQAGF